VDLLSYHFSRALPDSLLSASIQKAGRLDFVLRCMEDERLLYAKAPECEGLMELGHQIMFSEFWVGSVYETLRIVEREGAVATDAVRALTEDFRLVRVPLEKHQIAWEKNELTAPLQLQRVLGGYFNASIKVHGLPGGRVIWSRFAMTLA